MRRTVWIFSCVAIALLLQSPFRSDHVPFVYQAVILVIGVTAAIRPDYALIVVAALIPLGHLISTRVVDAYPFGFTEAGVLAFFAGYLWWNRRLRPSEPDGIEAPAYLMMAVVAASAIVQVTVLQRWHAYPQDYALDFFRYVLNDYMAFVPDRRPSVDGRGFFGTAMMAIEGLALVLTTRNLCRWFPELKGRVTAAVLVAGFIVAGSLFGRMATDLVEGTRSTGQILRDRWSSPAIPSLNISGAYLLMIAFLAAGWALSTGRQRVLGIAGVVLCMSAMWFTRSRSAVVAGSATLIAAGVLLFARVRALNISRAFVAAVVAAIALSALMVLADPFGVLAPRRLRSIEFRAMFAETALNMFASEPLFGVGIGQYVDRSAEFSPPELLRTYESSETHNNFLLVFSELGLVGGMAFVWLLAVAGWRLWPILRDGGADPRLLGTIAALAAFMVTWLSYQPLTIPQSGFTFWMLLGVALSTVPVLKDKAPSRWPARLAVAFAAVTCLALPLRAIEARSAVDLTHVTYGMFDWEMDPFDEPYRWTGPRATFHVRSSIPTIEIPVTASLQAAPAVTVDAYVNGQHAHREVLDVPWVRGITLQAPATDQPVWEVELRVSPTWVPSETLEGNTDQRELGVRLGLIPDVLYRAAPEPEESRRGRDGRRNREAEDWKNDDLRNR